MDEQKCTQMDRYLDGRMDRYLYRKMDGDCQIEIHRYGWIETERELDEWIVMGVERDGQLERNGQM